MYPAPLYIYIIGVDSNFVWGEGMNEQASRRESYPIPHVGDTHQQHFMSLLKARL